MRIVPFFEGLKRCSRLRAGVVGTKNSLAVSAEREVAVPALFLFLRPFRLVLHFFVLPCALDSVRLCVTSARRAILAFSRGILARLQTTTIT